MGGKTKDRGTRCYSFPFKYVWTAAGSLVYILLLQSHTVESLAECGLTIPPNYTFRNVILQLLDYLLTQMFRKWGTAQSMLVND